jgi:activator of HSP90 ATPase
MSTNEDKPDAILYDCEFACREQKDICVHQLKTTVSFGGTKQGESIQTNGALEIGCCVMAMFFIMLLSLCQEHHTLWTFLSATLFSKMNI